MFLEVAFSLSIIPSILIQ